MLAKIRKLFKNPKARLAARAVLAGVAVAYTHLKGGNIDRGAIEAALVAGAWAGIELVTPLNGVLGVFKQAEKVAPQITPYKPPAPPVAPVPPPVPPPPGA